MVALLLKFQGPNKVGLDPSCTWIKCTKTSFWCSNGSSLLALIETCRTSSFNADFNVVVLDLVIGSIETCNGSLIVFMGWSALVYVIAGKYYVINLRYPNEYGFLGPYRISLARTTMNSRRNFLSCLLFNTLCKRTYIWSVKKNMENFTECLCFLTKRKFKL